MIMGGRLEHLFAEQLPEKGDIFNGPNEPQQSYSYTYSERGNKTSMEIILTCVGSSGLWDGLWGSQSIHLVGCHLPHWRLIGLKAVVLEGP